MTTNPIFSPQDKNYVINNLALAKVNNFEFGSNVSKKIKEMANTSQVLESLEANKLKNLNLFLLVPNYKKYQ